MMQWSSKSSDLLPHSSRQSVSVAYDHLRPRYRFTPGGEEGQKWASGLRQNLSSCPASP